MWANLRSFQCRPIFRVCDIIHEIFEGNILVIPNQMARILIVPVSDGGRTQNDSRPSNLAASLHVEAHLNIGCPYLSGASFIHLYLPTGNTFINTLFEVYCDDSESISYFRYESTSNMTDPGRLVEKLSKHAAADDPKPSPVTNNIC